MLSGLEKLVVLLTALAEGFLSLQGIGISSLIWILPRRVALPSVPLDRRHSKGSPWRATDTARAQERAQRGERNGQAEHSTAQQIAPQ